MDIYKDAVHLSDNARKYEEMEWKYGCHNYYPLPVVLAKGEGVYVYDVDGKRYTDCLSAYSALNQGHCHPKIVEAAIKQIQTLTLTSRAFFNNKLGLAEEYLAKVGGYDKCIFMNTGVEGGETALKLARRWGYVKKKIPDNQAKIIFCNGNFWGRTIAACGSSDDIERYRQFGPFGGLGFELINYNDVDALEAKFKADPNYCAFMVEPIQGEMGVILPADGYLKKVRELCTKYNVLMICDEVQTGLGRTGKMFCYEWEGIKPDLVILGKALSGGILPVSAVLANDDVMLNIHPGEHGSTYGGNPLAAEVAVTSVKVIQEEHLVEKSLEMGEYFRELARKIPSPLIQQIRGRGLFSAIQISQGAWQFCLNMMKRGVLAKPTHENSVRFAPPLIMTKPQVEEVIKVIAEALAELEQMIKDGKLAPPSH
jgi:ornithine--oxo-acid transaminase